MELPVKETPDVSIIEEEDTTIGLESRVLLFNDDWHSFEEVIIQLIKATKCSFDEAKQKTFEVHIKGKAIVFNGSVADCLKVSGVLEEIALHTQVLT